MIFEILDKDNKVENRIIAELGFVEEHYKGLYRDVTPKPVLVEVTIVKDDMTKVKDALKSIAAKVGATVDL